MKTPNFKQGFSLMEMAIVVVIIGLVAGSTVVAKSMIRSTQLQSVITDYSMYDKAARTFIDKYSAIPGDMSNATTTFGAIHATPLNCRQTVVAVTQSLSCNGNGNGVIQTFDTTDNNTRYSESRFFWQHLRNAKLITKWQQDGFNFGSPQSALKNGYWGIYFLGTVSGSSYLFDADYGHVFTFGDLPDATWQPIRPTLLPKEAFEIDEKIDDGLPGSGNVMNFPWVNTGGGDDNVTYDNENCSTTANLTTARYAITYNYTYCGLLFKATF